MTPLATRLYQAWQAAIADNKILSEFTAGAADPAGRWHQGDRILYGIRLQTGQPEYYARNLTQDSEVPGEVVEKSVGPYFCQLNGYRALRPGGSNRPLGRQPDISAAPDHCRFHCMNPDHPLSLCDREPLLQVALPNFVWHAYYNAAPLEKAGHFLWIPTEKSANGVRLPHWPQRLSVAFFADMVALLGELSDTIVFFNALHAGASVNHIHFQAVYQRQPLPIESAPAVDYQGVPLLKDYAIPAIAYSLQTPVDEMFAAIDWLQIHDIPFNLALVGSRVVIVPRNIDHEIVSEFPGDSLAALGMCGALKTISRQAYDTMDEVTINRAFAKMTISGNQIVDAWQGLA